MALSEPIREIAYHPAAMVDPTILGQFADFLRHDAAGITGCVFSGLLSAKFGFAPTIGEVATEDLLAHHSALRRLGFTGGTLLCDSHVLRQETVDRFRHAFGNTIRND